jgi:hypothetical protein
MDEPALDNRSGFHAVVWPILDRNGADSRIVIVKATFDLLADQPPKPAEQPRDIRQADVPWGVPEIADIRLSGDYGLPKPGTDVVFSGHAQAEPRRVSVDVGLRAADRTLIMRVHGRREWRQGVSAVVPGASDVMRDPVPLAWSRAYGGFDDSDPQCPLEESRNPVGTGIARQPSRLIGTRAPQIEAPDLPIAGANGAHVPVGCAPLGRHFEPRRGRAGTYDSAWLRTGYPARPADYHEAHEHAAAPSLTFEQPLRGGEEIGAAGVRNDGPLRFALPRWRIVVQAEVDAAVQERRPHLDTVVVDTDARLLEMTWRSLFRCPPKMRGRFPWVRVLAKEFSA